MNYSEMLRVVKELGYDTKLTIFSEQGIEIYLLRSSSLPARFKGYHLAKNFQIFLKEGEREFKPNHLRIMIDLHLRVRSRPDLKKDLLTAFDKIFYGMNPDEAVADLQKERFEHFLNPLGIIANLSQLFIIEQDYNYTKPSNFDPATLFYQGWIRQFIDSSKEIDNLCMSVCNGQPPASKYTISENRKHKKYNQDVRPLWYLNDEATD
jgi:hypothetical protein